MIETLVDPIEQFMSAKATMTNSSKKAYNWTLSNFNKFCISNDIDILDASEQDIAHYMQQYNNHAYKTRIAYKKILSSFYNYYVKRGIIKFNPVEDIIIKGNSRKLQKQFMNIEDFNQILERSQNLRILAILNFLWYTGVRATELIELRIKDVDLKNETIFVSLSKTYTGNRSIPIHPAFRKFITWYYEKRLKDNEVSKSNKFKNKTDEHLFLNKQNKKLNYRTLLQYVKQSQKGLKSDFACHDFRRAFGTNVYNDTKDIITVQILLGHSSIETTRKYIGIDFDNIRDKFNRTKFNK